MESETTQSAAFFRFLGWLETNKKQVAYAVVAALGVGLVIWFFVWQSGKKAADAEEALSRAFVPQLTGSAAKSEAAQAYLQVVKSYPKSAAAARALLMAGASLFADGKYTEAEAQFRQFAREHSSSPFLGQAQFGVAASLEAQGKTNDAVTAYKVVIDRRSSESVVPQAKYSLARLHAALGKPELALPLYEDVAKTDPYGATGSEAGMRAEELKQQFPNLAPPPPQAMTFTNAPFSPTVTLSNNVPSPDQPK